MKFRANCLALLLGACASTGVSEESPAEVVSPRPETAAPGEAINQVRYIVDEEVITDIDIDRMRENLDNLDKLNPSPKRNDKDTRTRAIETLIERAIVLREAREESIIVSDARVDNEMEKRRNLMGIADEDEFRRLVEKEAGMPYDRWREEMRYQYVRQQIIQIKIPVPQPTEQDVEEFYEKNKARFGMEVRFREILLRPKDGSLDDELRISKLARKIRGEISGNPKSFARIARSYAENLSPFRRQGGLQNYTPIQDVAERDRLLAGMVFRLPVGKLSDVFRNTKNEYMIVMVEGRRSVPLEKVRRLIHQRLFVEKERGAFEEWLEGRKKEVVIIEVKPS